MRLIRQQLALTRSRKQLSSAKSHKPKTSSNLRSMSTSKEAAATSPSAKSNDDSAIPEHLKSWLPGMASIDDLIPLSTDVVIAKISQKPKPDGKPKPKEQGKNRGLEASTVRQLNLRLRKYGLTMKHIVPAGVDPIPGVQTNSESIQSSDEFAEYEIVGMKGESKNWVLNTLAAAAQDDKADKVFQMQVEKEKADGEAAGDDHDEEASFDDGDDKETAVNSGSEDGAGNGKGRKRTGSGPRLGVFYEPIVPAATRESGR